MKLLKKPTYNNPRLISYHDKYEVERILAVRGPAEIGRRLYLVRWLGYDGDEDEESTWEPAEEVAENAAEAIYLMDWINKTIRTPRTHQSRLMSSGRRTHEDEICH
eukprot:SAG11_NODE_749_length_7363_cov_12.270099_3_plen_106_part_00